MTDKKLIYAALAAVLICSVAFLGCPTAEEMVDDVVQPVTPPTPEVTPTMEDTEEDTSDAEGDMVEVTTEDDATELPDDLTGLPDDLTGLPDDSTEDDSTEDDSMESSDDFNVNPNPLPTNQEQKEFRYYKTDGGFVHNFM